MKNYNQIIYLKKSNYFKKITKIPKTDKKPSNFSIPITSVDEVKGRASSGTVSAGRREAEPDANRNAI